MSTSSNASAGGRRVRVGLIGSQFIAAIHAESVLRNPAAELFSVASPTPGNAQKFAQKLGVPHHFTDYRKMLEQDELDMVVIGAPNQLHCQMTVDAAAAGKHVVCEKPLAMNLAEADRMIEACRKAKVHLMYAEELCFTPKYVRMKQLLDEGALGYPTLVKQMEKHDGPHAPHFWDVTRSGGGVTMDMGCHAIEFFRWMLGGKHAGGRRRANITSAYAQMGTYVHKDKTKGDDNAILVFETDAGAVCVAEESWTKLGGMDDRAEVHGSKGVALADLLHGNAIETYSTVGYGYAVEKAGSTVGWSFTIYEEAWNYGFPQEIDHFVRCAQGVEQPIVTGEDGRAVLEAIFAAYESAGTGRKIALPFKTDAKRPIDLWRKV